MNLMKYFRCIAVVLASILMLEAALGANVYNSNGDFSVSLDKQKSVVPNQDIQASFSFDVENLIGDDQDFALSIPEQTGWNIEASSSSFSLNQGSSRTITIDFVATSEFDYSPAVVSPDEIKITSREDYKGYFTFPVTIYGEDEEVSLTFEVEIVPKNLVFTSSIPTSPVSPNVPFKFSLTSQDAQGERVSVKAQLGDYVIGDFTDSFTEQNNYKIYEFEVPSSLSPGEYTSQVLVRVEEEGYAKEWKFTQAVDVLEYKQLDVNSVKKEGFIVEKTTYTVENKGNVPTTFEESIEVPFYKRPFLSSEQDYTIDNGVLMYAVELEQGETLEFTHTYNYLALYIVLFVVLVVLSYIYVRKNSNPLDVETKIYNVKRVEHEGVKSLKVRIGFENIKADEIEDLKIVFRMPTYLNVKDETFLLSEPNKVFKGSSQYKLIWDFKRFEKNDSRILGFTLVNKRGILGDIRIPDLEIEVTMNGKQRKYYQSFPIVRG